jgi:iron uptake system component EfeO
MNRLPHRMLMPAAGFALVAILATGCGSSDSAPKDAKVLSFQLTDKGCAPHDATAPAGAIVFEATGDSASVTEIEVLEGETILGEKENLSEGISGSFWLTLDPGKYTLRCNGGSEGDGTLTVTGKSPTATGPASSSAHS